MLGYSVLGIIGVFMALTLYCCCVMSGRSNKFDEELETESQLNTMLGTGEYDRDLVTIADCMDMCKKYNLGVELNDGKVIRFKHN